MGRGQTIEIIGLVVVGLRRATAALGHGSAVRRV
jgi:hypothetical protein